MRQSPMMVEALARDRVAELRGEAAARALVHGVPVGRFRLQSARRVTGWFLVDLGLRLAAARNVARSL